ncbi:jg2915 [Pararge aegeria aegeria]|uniref:Jg2915 protein n=1 Tax=Pararge aegeria aegeria TaxID=348720 RepID=A0A8S4SGH9_9NEOP|nr:jg2915 [Pararge aegeria aegeria]
MDRKVLSIFLFLIHVKPQVDLSIAVRKFNHQKDMSEYCRRRVAPSVFLGKQVMEASSHIMHFSQLEVPYSCTLSVRTESGNNIILVIQLLSEMGLIDACAQNADQLIIYEFGETFGGYWGHLPHTMIKKTTKNYTQFYTLKTTKPTTTTERYHNIPPNGELPIVNNLLRDKKLQFIVNQSATLQADYHAKNSSYSHIRRDEDQSTAYKVNMSDYVTVYLAPNLSIYEKKNLEGKKKSDKTIDLNVRRNNLHHIALSGELPIVNNLLRDKKLQFIVNQSATLQADYHAKNSSYSHIRRDEDQSTAYKVNMSDYVTENVKPLQLDKTSNNISIKNDIDKSHFLQKGRMVDHESWENIVQAAPVMAVVLNKSEIFSNVTQKGREEHNKVDKRNKRHIHALEVENSRPRNLTTQRALTRGTEMQYQFSDLQDLAALVELQDDELEGMTLVLTPAQSLADSMSMCEPGHLECQIIGTRVCIDSMNACDAVPNCGSYDIYDEDRLKCGVTQGLQHNVYLAAFTFLAVILTILYTIQYWLKRCVPKVSDAFFIYTDATENTLLLDTIMRSPNEGDETSSKFVYSGQFFDNDTLYGDGFKGDLNENVCKKIISKCCAYLICKKRREEPADYVNEVNSVPLDKSNIFSFTEYELRRFAQSTLREEAVQTGESLEMQSEISKDEHKDVLRQGIEQDPLVKLKAVDDQASRYDEKEIRSTVYERISNTNINPEKIRVKCEVHSENIKKHFDSNKRLRFDEELTMIPSIESGGEITTDILGGRISVFGTGEQSNQDFDTITQDEPGTSDSRDFMRFWGTSKGKKGKKKKEKQLRMH